MRIRDENDLAARRVKRGRAVVVGLGLDDGEGHIRYTRGDDIELYGGSQASHAEMQRRMRKIQDEIARLGIRLDSMTFEQYQTLRDIVNRINCE